MLIKFKGEYIKEPRSYGCSKCGTGRSISGVETYKTVYRTYYYPRVYTFVKDKIYPVDDILGKYLLNLKYTDPQGIIRRQFEEVPENLETEYVSNIEDNEIPITEDKPATTETR